MAIEIHQTKRRIVYRAVISTGEPGAKPISKTFPNRADAEAWERDMLQGEERETARP